MDRWINTVFYSHMVRKCSGMKRKEALTPAASWVDLENIIPSETSQTTKDTYSKVPFIGNAQNGQIHRDKVD